MGRCITGKQRIDYDRIYGHEKPMKNTHTLELYKGRKKEWRWRMRAKNGKIVANGGEGYKRKQTMMRTLQAIEVAFLEGSYDRKDF